MVDRMICKTNGRNKVVDFRDNLIPSGVDDYAMLHGAGGKNHAIKSTIKMTICDFSKGTGEGNSITASANLSPDKIATLYLVAEAAMRPVSPQQITITEAGAKELAEAKEAAASLYRMMKKDDADIAGCRDILAKAGAKIGSAMTGISRNENKGGPSYTYTQDRVNIHAKKPDGTAPVNKLFIERAGVRKDGALATYPWLLKIVNGIAMPKESATGSCTYDPSTFRVEREAFIQVSDADMFRMLERCQAFIRVWENATCIPQVLQGLQAVETERLEWAQNRQ